MSKYIRMEDGIFNTYDMFINMLKEFKERDWDFTTIKVEQKYGEKTLSCGCKCFNSTIPYEITIQFIKQADTIEKLCDEFVLNSNPIHASRTLIKIDFEKKIVYQWQSAKNVAEYTFEQFLRFHTIYGAIWVTGENNEPILKSVAKINEKGELELL